MTFYYYLYENGMTGIVRGQAGDMIAALQGVEAELLASGTICEISRYIMQAAGL